MKQDDNALNALADAVEVMRTLKVADVNGDVELANFLRKFLGGRGFAIVPTADLLPPRIAEEGGQFMSIDEFCKFARIRRTMFYAELNNGRIGTMKRGQRRFIAREEAERWLRESLI